MADKPLKIEGPERIERHHDQDETLIRGGNLKLLGIIGAVILVAAGGWFFFNRQAQASEAEASIALGRITSYMNRGDYEKAIQGDQALLINNRPIMGLVAIVDEYGSTNAGKRAALMLGNAYMLTEKPAEAAEAFRTAAESGDELTRAAALAGIASVAEAEGKYEEAAAGYDEAAAALTSDISRPIYLFAAAKNYEKASKQETAIERYREIAMQYPMSEQNNIARLALARHGVEI